MVPRDRIYLIIDILSKLIEHGELNQSTLILYCRLNLTKHKEILNELESKNFIIKKNSSIGKKTVMSYKITTTGLDFYKSILKPYETFFPRDRDR